MHNFQWFVEKAKSIHGDEYLYDKTTYFNTHTPVQMTHMKCGYTFFQTPHNHLKGQGCPKCAKEYVRKCKKNNYKHFIEESDKRFDRRYSFPNITKEYENSHSKITIKCNYCGNIFIKTACDFLTSKTGGCWCVEKDENKITYNDLISKIDNFNIDFFKDEKNINDKVVIVCKKCGFKRIANIKSLMTGNYKCNACEGRKNGKYKIISLVEIQKRLKERFPNLIIDPSSYKGTMKPSTYKCKDCGHEFSRSVNSLFYGSPTKNGCPNCSQKIVQKERTKTTEKYINDVYRVYGKKLYTVIGEYISSNKPIKIKCNKCGREFDIEANSFLQGHGCPFHNCNSSGKEKEIVEYIKTLLDKEKIVTNDKNILDGKELDIYLPLRKIAFEFDGIFWHNENNKTNDYHLKKTEECEKKGIRLIHIFEDEWLFKQDIWKSMISNILGKSKNKIYARKCIIKNVDSKECKQFLDDNHLQGWCPSQIKIGLYYGNKLVSIMTFGKSRHYFGDGKTEYELLRFCNKKFTNVIGGASKLFNYFVKNFNPKDIVSYADRRWSLGKLYDKIGFVFSHYSKPNYYYVIGNKRKNRFNFRKSILVKKYNCPTIMSEKEFCRSQKWWRIYDCGTSVYKWHYNN